MRDSPSFPPCALQRLDAATAWRSHAEWLGQPFCLTPLPPRFLHAAFAADDIRICALYDTTPIR